MAAKSSAFFLEHFLRSREDEHKLFLLKRPNKKFANGLKCNTLLPQADDREQCLRIPAMMLFVPRVSELVNPMTARN